MSKIEVNTVAPQCGTTLTLGESGDTVALGTGASQSGFGRTGTVDWQTGSIKTSTFTAVNGQGFFANTSGGAFTMNLPAGSAGNIVSVVDYTNTFQTNALTISPNGSQKIGGTNADVVLETEGQSVTFVYVDDTEGWKNVQDSTSNVIGNAFIIATGGTVTCSGNDRIHTFTGPGTFTVCTAAVCAADNVISYVIVGAGGTGGSCNSGGGGAGGFREVKSPVTPYTASPLDGYPSSPNRVTVSATSYPIVIGGGAALQTGGFKGSNGSNSSAFSITAAGGGGGGSNASPAPGNGEGADGGSGGGAKYDYTSSPQVGSGNTPPTTPSQGFPGGVGTGPGANAGGGGGGATAAGGVGSSPPSGNAGAGGAGATTSINGSPIVYAGGGGGGAGSSANGGAGGSGGGGYGSNNPGVPNSNNPGATPITQAGDGTTNRGGGGGGSNGTNPSGPPYSACQQVAGKGGSGIVIIRYKRL